MAVHIPAGYAQVTFHFSGPTRTGRAAAVLGMDTGASSDLTELATWASNAFYDNIRPGMHEAFTLQRVTAEDMVFSGEYLTLSGEGDRSGDLAPPQVSVIVSKGTALKGRPYRGRTYWPGLLNDSDIFDDGTIQGARQLAIQNYMDDFWAEMTSVGSAQQYLLHNTEIAPTAVASYGVQNKVATQRRRLR